MRSIYTISNPDKVVLGHTDRSDSEPAITIGSPFWGLPTYDEEGSKKVNSTQLLLIDLNVLDCIRKGKNKDNIRNLFKWASETETFIMPHIALSEQSLNHKNPESAFYDYIDSLNQNYDFQMPKSESTRLYDVFLKASKGVRSNTEMMRDYLVIIKHFYNKKCSLEEKVILLCELIHDENIPVFAFAVKVGCLFFYIKQYPDNFADAIVRKIQSDMAISSNPINEEKRLWNFASDLMLFMAPVTIFFNEEFNEYNFSYIASSDATVALILSEICYGEIIINEGKCFGKPGIRPSSMSVDVLDPLLTKHLKQSSQHSTSAMDADDPRRDNLKALAEKLTNSPSK